MFYETWSVFNLQLFDDLLLDGWAFFYEGDINEFY